MIRVLIVEGKVMVLGALAALLGTEPAIEVVAQASDGRDPLSQALDLQVVDGSPIPGLWAEAEDVRPQRGFDQDFDGFGAVGVPSRCASHVVTEPAAVR